LDIDYATHQNTKNSANLDSFVAIHQLVEFSIIEIDDR